MKTYKRLLGGAFLSILLRQSVMYFFQGVEDFIRALVVSVWVRNKRWRSRKRQRKAMIRKKLTKDEDLEKLQKHDNPQYM